MFGRFYANFHFYGNFSKNVFNRNFENDWKYAEIQNFSFLPMKEVKRLR
jgi:hypothetical protein